MSVPPEIPHRSGIGARHLAKALCDLPAVELGDTAFLVEDRDDDRAIHVLVTALADHTQRRPRSVRYCIASGLCFRLAW